MKKLFISISILALGLTGFGQTILNLNQELTLSGIEDYLYASEPVSRTIYVDSLNGDDQSGCGTLADPFQSIKRACEDILTIVDGVEITIKIDTFQNEFNYSEISSILSGLLCRNNGIIRFEGYAYEYISSLTLSQDATYPTKYAYSGATLTSNEIQGMYVVKNANNHYPISSNDLTDLWLCDASSAGSRQILQNKTTIVNSESVDNWLDLTVGGDGTGSIEFININFDYDGWTRMQITRNQFLFYRCNSNSNFDITSSDLGYNLDRTINIKQCYFNATTANDFRLRGITNGYCQLRDVAIAGSGSNSFYIQNGVNQNIANLILDGIILELIGSTDLFVAKSLTFRNLTNSIIAQGGPVMLGNGANAEIITENVTNLFSYGSGNNTAEIIKGGFVDTDGSYTNLFAEISDYQALEDYTINLPGLWQKNERIVTDITNNTSGNIEIGDTLQNKAIYMDYSVTRQDSTEIGTITLSGRNDTEINNTVDATFDEAEITFSKNISGSTVRLGYTLSDATYDAVLTLVIRRAFN